MDRVRGRAEGKRVRPLGSDGEVWVVVYTGRLCR